jgi:hypothetical protein
MYLVTPVSFGMGLGLSLTQKKREEDISYSNIFLIKIASIGFKGVTLNTMERFKSR